MKRLKKNRGESLIETIVSMAIFSIMFVAIVSMFSLGNQIMNHSAAQKRDFTQAISEINSASPDSITDKEVYDSSLQITFNVTRGGVSSSQVLSYSPTVTTASENRLMIEITE